MPSQTLVPEFLQELNDSIIELADPPASSYLTSLVKPDAYTKLEYYANPPKWPGAKLGGGKWRRPGEKSYAMVPIFGQIQRANVGPFFSMEGAPAHKFNDMEQVRNQRAKIELYIADPSASRLTTNLFRCMVTNLMDMQRVHENRPTVAQVRATRVDKAPDCLLREWNRSRLVNGVNTSTIIIQGPKVWGGDEVDEHAVPADILALFSEDDNDAPVPTAPDTGRISLRDWHPIYENLKGASEVYLTENMPTFNDPNGQPIPIKEVALHYTEGSWVFAECRPQMWDVKREHTYQLIIESIRLLAAGDGPIYDGDIDFADGKMPKLKRKAEESTVYLTSPKKMLDVTSATVGSPMTGKTTDLADDDGDATLSSGDEHAMEVAGPSTPKKIRISTRHAKAKNGAK